MARRREAFNASLSTVDGPNQRGSGSTGSASGGRQTSKKPTSVATTKTNTNKNTNPNTKKSNDGSGVVDVKGATKGIQSLTTTDSSSSSSSVPSTTTLTAPTTTSTTISPSPGPGSGFVSDPDLPPAVSDDETCFICAERIVFYALGVCNHRTCHVCALRLRVFYKKVDCTFCKTKLPTLVVTSDAEREFPIGSGERDGDGGEEGALVKAGWPKSALKPQEALTAIANDKIELEPGQLDLRMFRYVDDKLGLVFETSEMMDATLLLLRFNCPEPSCDFMAASWDGLEKHTFAVHKSVLCHLCRRQLSRFAHEHVLYPPHLLPLHDPSRLPRGHRKPHPRGKVEEDMVAQWGDPHPMCEFCHEAFFGPDELFKHMRNRHEECFVCKQRGDRDVYFQDYRRLEMHFNGAHYPCTEASCLEKKFVVFPTELDWRAHMVSEHHASMNSRDRNAARVLPINFVGPLSGDHSSIPPDPSAHQYRNGEPSSNASRTEGQSQFSTKHRRRDGGPQSQQLQQNSQDDRNARRAHFGAGLTQPEPERPSGSGNGKGKSRSGASTPSEASVDDFTAARHADLLNRVAVLVDFSDVKLSSFKHAVRQFKNNESPARDMVNVLYIIFDNDTDTTLRVAKEIANLMNDDRGKVQSILEAINAFKVERQSDFPSLGSTPGGVGTEFAGVASGRILSAKSAAQYSSASNAVFDRVERAASSHPVARPAGTSAGPGGRRVPGATSTNAFPALGSTSSSAGPSRSQASNSTPWSGRSTTSMPAPIPVHAPAPVIRSVNMPAVTSKGPARLKAPSTSAFPSLVSTSNRSGMSNQERQSLFKNGTAREEALRRMGGTNSPPVNGWSTVNANGSSTPSSVQDEWEEPPPPRPTGGKKKGKKEILFTVSARPT